MRARFKKRGTRERSEGDWGNSAKMVVMIVVGILIHSQ